MTIDEVAGLYAGRARLSVRLLPKGPDEEGVSDIVIEGDITTLQFLIDVLTALLREEDCGWGLQPPQDFFGETEFGIYFHRLPCMNEQLKATSRQDQSGSSSRASGEGEFEGVP